MAFKLDSITEKLQNLPDSAFQGPLLKYKVEYKKMVKRLRRGESNQIITEAQNYGTPATDKYKGEKFTEEDIVKIKDTIAKMTNFVVKVAGTIGTVIAGVKAYKGIKDGLATVAKLAEKTNSITATTMVGAGGPFTLIAWLQRKAVNLAMAFSYSAAIILILVLKWESRLVKYAGGIVGFYALAVKFYFGAKVLKAARAEKWGTASHDDVMRAQQEADSATAYADDQENKFYKDVRGSGAFDDTIFQEDEEMDLEYEDELIHDITYGK